MHKDVVDNHGSGQLDLTALDRAIGPRTKLIASTHVPRKAGSSIRRPKSAISPRATASSICSAWSSAGS
jgi:selenocysteine lyase/cysteine desulfurase